MCLIKKEDIFTNKCLLINTSMEYGYATCIIRPLMYFKPLWVGTRYSKIIHSIQNILVLLYTCVFNTITFSWLIEAQYKQHIINLTYLLETTK